MKLFASLCIILLTNFCKQKYAFDMKTMHDRKRWAVNARFEREEYEAILKAAKAEDRSVSAWVRRLILRELGRLKKSAA